MSRRRAARALDLARRVPAARQPLQFFADVARFQAESIPRQVHWRNLAGLLPVLRDELSPGATGAIRKVLCELTEEELQERLLWYWARRETSTLESLPARILLQRLAHARSPAAGLPPPSPASGQEQTCPFCSHSPQVGLLEPAGHGKSLILVCSLCLKSWPGRRNACTLCGETGREVLHYYSAENLSGRSLQCCSRCRAYVHLIDLEAHPGAVAEADEIAGLVLDVWAVQQGFTKHQCNLAGI